MANVNTQSETNPDPINSPLTCLTDLSDLAMNSDRVSKALWLLTLSDDVFDDIRHIRQSLSQSIANGDHEAHNYLVDAAIELCVGWSSRSQGSVTVDIPESESIRDIDFEAIARKKLDELLHHRRSA